MRKIIVDGPGKASASFSPAVIVNGFVFVTGQGPMDHSVGASPDGFEAQVRQTLRNLRAVLNNAGVELEDVVKISVYLADLAHFSEFDAIYREFFRVDPPARTTIGCQLPGFLIEIDCIAVLPSAIGSSSLD
jgi:2-iminobutanoate/2-iminopropanoate deaminase